MKIKLKQKNQIHDWFAWYPIKVYSGYEQTYYIVWLEKVERILSDSETRYYLKEEKKEVFHHRV
jgi:hypothetical protein